MNALFFALQNNKQSVASNVSKYSTYICFVSTTTGERRQQRDCTNGIAIFGHSRKGFLWVGVSIVVFSSTHSYLFVTRLSTCTIPCIRIVHRIIPERPRTWKVITTKSGWHFVCKTKRCCVSCWLNLNRENAERRKSVIFYGGPTAVCTQLVAVFLRQVLVPVCVRV